MLDKKKILSFITAILFKNIFLTFSSLLILLPAYTSSSSVYDFSKVGKLEIKPKHIGIIMDGNGRWGKQEVGNRSYGHQHAKQAVTEVISGCLEQGIPYLTLYAFSTENWKRPEQEIKTIFKVIAQNITEHINLFTKYNIRFRVVGDTAGIPTFCWNQLKKVIETTKANTALNLTVAINYGGKAEAVAASEALVNDFLLKIVDEFLDKGFDANCRFENFIRFAQDYRAKITPSIYTAYLHTGHLPDVDLLIRTGGKKRISNFLPWQCAYSELYFTDLYWPAFTKADLLDSLIFFQQQHRNFGGIL